MKRKSFSMKCLNYQRAPLVLVPSQDSSVMKKTRIPPNFTTPFWELLNLQGSLEPESSLLLRKVVFNQSKN